VKSFILTLAAAAALVLAATAGGAAEEPQAAEFKAGAEQLAKMDRLIGGKWWAKDGKPLNAYHLAEWGVNKKMLHVRTYFPAEGGDKLFSDAVFFWHPARKGIAALALGPSGEVYDGGMKFEGDTWTQEFQYFSPKGTVDYRETWVFNGSDEYTWTLFHKTADGLKKQMEATFVRKR
jgi:hypothetical protein